jgi:hypothetical protein
MKLSFGTARPLYRAGQHPRLLMGPADLVELRLRIRSGTGRKIWQALLRKVAPLFEELAAAPDSTAWLAGDGTWSSLPARLLFGINDMALAARLEKRPVYIDLIRKLLRALCAADPVKGRACIRLADMALAYDLLYDAWAPEDREAFTRAGLATLEARLEASQLTYFKNAGANIPLLNFIGAVPVALVLRGEPGVPGTLEDSLSRLILRVEAAVNVTANENGYPEEDGGYGYAIMGRLVEYAEMLHRAGLFDVYTACPPFARSGRALLHLVQPWGEALSNTGDHGDDFGHRELALARLAARTRDPALIWLLRTLSYTRESVFPISGNGRFSGEVALAPKEQVPASYRSLLALD